MATTFTKIASVTVGAGGASTIDFTSIPQTFTDLKIVLSVRTTGSAVNFNDGALRFNSDSGSNYSTRFLLGDGSSASSSSASTSYIPFGPNQGSLTTANTFTSFDGYIPNYTGSSFKSVSSDGTAENNATATRMTLTAGLWSSTAAITSINVFPGGGYNFVQYSTATLYGIKNS